MHRLFAMLAPIALLMAGCGDPSSQPLTKLGEESIALSDVGELYRVYTAQKKKPPTRLADFAPMEPMCPMGVRAVESGNVIVRLGAVMTDTEEGPPKGTSDEVLAYLKEVPDSGGQVLMLNREIRTMTPEEFKAAKLAGTESSAPAAAKKDAKKAN